MSFVEMLGAARTWAAGNLPITVGGFVAILVLTFLAVNATVGRGRRRRVLTAAKLAASHAMGDKALNWETPEQSYADRRGAVRREGQPVRVALASTTFRNGVGDGYVIDRSTGGLKLATQSAIAPGTTLQVRALDAPDTIGSVTVIVRSCRKNTDYYEIGCEFDKTPPWNVLLLFG